MIYSWKEYNIAYKKKTHNTSIKRKRKENLQPMMIFLVFIMWGACCHLTLPTVWTLRRLRHISLWFFSTNPNLPTPRTLIFLCKYTWWLVSLSAPLKGKRVQNFIGIWELSHGQKLVTWKWAISRKNLCLTCNHSRGVRRIRAQEREGSIAISYGLSEASEGHLTAPTKLQSKHKHRGPVPLQASQCP